MPYHILSAPCLRIIQDKNSDLTSLMDIVDTAFVEPDTEPSLPPFKLFSKWGKSTPENELEKFDVKISLSGPKITRKKQVDKFSVEIPKNASGVTMILDLGAIKVKESGLWFIHITFKASLKGKWKEVCALPFMVRSKPKPASITEQVA